MKLLLFFVISLFILNCSNANVKNDYQVRKKTNGEYEIKRGMSMTPGKDDEKLEHAKRLMVKKKYKKAEKLFKEVYEDTSIKDEYREDALLQLGDLYSNFLNPNKDYKKSEMYYKKLLDEFPKSKLKDKTEEKIKNLDAKK